ncbi:MAG: M61 family metallopeptidase [Gemmatimonadetes bacterium]|nr:M61 family metallopeptidase [Gemmatimonadota bacterium]
MISWRGLVLLVALPSAAGAQEARYRVDVRNPAEDVFRVRAEFSVPPGRDSFLVSLPAWTTGSYRIENYARHVHGFSARTPDGRNLFWEKVDKDTWRIATGGARQVVVELLTNPDSFDLAMSQISPDFAFFNGTNLFLYPEGTDYAFSAEVTVEVPEGWRIATGLPQAGAPGRYRAANYHDLVDAPFFLGRLASDSVEVDGRTIRFAIYPDSALTPAVWDSVSDAIRRIATVQNRIFGGPPYDAYTVLFFAPFTDMQWGGGLEHHNSQFDAIAGPFFAPDRRTGRLGDFVRPLLSHEFFHLWNVKRIRPAELWPYDYSREQYTPLLWWSEGVTDYFGDVTLARAGMWSVERFLGSMNGNVQQVEVAAEIVSVEDASINTWIHPTFVNESQYYYPKGALLGLMLDIQIRDATGNQHNLDEIIRGLYTSYHLRGRGFTTQDLLGLIRPWFRGVDDFYARYINGREPLPYEAVLPRGGIAVQRREIKTAIVGVQTSSAREGGVVIDAVTPGSLAASVGLEPGDVLLRMGDVVATNPQRWGAMYRARYQNSEGQPIDVVLRRDGREMTRRGTVRVHTSRAYQISRDPAAAPAAAAILAGITGAVR